MRKRVLAVSISMVLLIALVGTGVYLFGRNRAAEVTFAAKENGTFTGKKRFTLKDPDVTQTGEFAFSIKDLMKASGGAPLHYMASIKLEGELFEENTPILLGLQRAKYISMDDKGIEYSFAVNAKKESFTYITYSRSDAEKYKILWRWMNLDGSENFKGKTGTVTVKVEPYRLEKTNPNVFGINTMIFEGDNIDQHLDWAHHLVGDGGYIRQMFGPIKKSTKGPAGMWNEILKGCYKRNLIPIIRITADYANNHWEKPEATAPGDYSELAAAVKRVFEQLPMKKGVPVYVEILNEVNLNLEWGNDQPDPVEYGHLLVDVSQALRSIGDPRIRIITAGLSQTNHHLQFIEDMIKRVPDSLYAFDYWGSHPYPGSRPPEINIHDGTAKDFDTGTIDAYIPELKILEKYGRKDVKVILTETGYSFGNTTFGMGYVTEEKRKDCTVRAFTDYWCKWPELIAACPYELSAVQAKNWVEFDWVHFDSGSDEKGYPTKPYPHYEAVAALTKPEYVADPLLQDTEDKNMEGLK